MTGYSFTYKAIKYAYYSSELINILTEGGMMAVLAPLLEQLKLFGVTGPTALVRLYYLGCDHTLRVKTDRSPRHREYLPHCSGVLLPDCPLEVLQYVKVEEYLAVLSGWLQLSCRHRLPSSSCS